MADETSTEPSNVFLPSSLKTTIKNWMDNSSDVKSAQVELNTESDTVDLLRDKIVVTRDVTMNGRYLSKRHMFLALEDAYREQENEIKSYFSVSS